MTEDLTQLSKKQLNKKKGMEYILSTYSEKVTDEQQFNEYSYKYSQCFSPEVSRLAKLPTQEEFAQLLLVALNNHKKQNDPNQPAGGDDSEYEVDTDGDEDDDSEGDEGEEGEEDASVTVETKLVGKNKGGTKVEKPLDDPKSAGLVADETPVGNKSSVKVTHTATGKAITTGFKERKLNMGGFSMDDFI